MVDASHVPKMKSVVVVPSEAGPSSQADAKPMEAGQQSIGPDSAAGTSHGKKQKQPYKRAAHKNTTEERQTQHQSTGAAKHMDAGRVQKKRDEHPSLRSRLDLSRRH